MKKILLVGSLVLVAVAAVGVGSAAAQGQVPPLGRGAMAGGGAGVLHSYIVDAAADALQIDAAAIDQRLQDGETLRDIALSAGIAADDLPAFLEGIHSAAVEAAVADGALTDEQASFMARRMQLRAGAGYGTGDCPMGGQGAPYGSGARRGGGGMMGGQGWQTQ
jgi:hypothetical protein